MVESRSVWRTGDGVAYDSLRSVVDDRIALLLTAEPADAVVLDTVVDLRRRVLAVDGFDRTAVDELRAEFKRYPS